MLMSVMDPDGAKQRKGNRLVRRIYQNKVNRLCYPVFVYFLCLCLPAYKCLSINEILLEHS